MSFAGKKRIWGAAIAPFAVLAAALTLGATAPAPKQDAPLVKYFDYGGGVAADGYDVVSYFVEERAVRGSGQFTAHYDGQTWHFSSEENRDLFIAAPQKFTPQYGGHCAFGVAQGYLVRGDPEAWSVHEGRLYLNYNDSIRSRWLRSRDNYITTAEQNWPGLVE